MSSPAAICVFLSNSAAKNAGEASHTTPSAFEPEMQIAHCFMTGRSPSRWNDASVQALGVAPICGSSLGCWLKEGGANLEICYLVLQISMKESPLFKNQQPIGSGVHMVQICQRHFQIKLQKRGLPIQLVVYARAQRRVMASPHLAWASK